MIVISTASDISSPTSFGRTFMATSAPVTSVSMPSRQTDNTAGLEKALTQLNQDFALIGIEFDIHDDSGRIVTRVIDRESGDVIRQIPTEEVLHMARMAARQQGRILQTTA
ncbi:flagellar protein FlaG [uncultured Kushneria sp.]|uniref:flagellar protein FlaG n=1 Tax=uncultured Kushneria sp. TaxID=905033 RepID=UPI0026207692|nr:flagellar protein FlaG [uncultured Kushneria sp.]